MVSKDVIKVRQKKYVEDNREKVRDNRRKSRLKNKATIKAYESNNKDALRAKCAKRRARTGKAAPNWLSKEQLSEINKIYSYARLLEKITGGPHHVDHIIPLKGGDICGLHVPWNLQALPAKENLQKGTEVDYDQVLV